MRRLAKDFESEDWIWLAHAAWFELLISDVEILKVGRFFWEWWFEPGWCGNFGCSVSITLPYPAPCTCPGRPGKFLWWGEGLLTRFPLYRQEFRLGFTDCLQTGYLLKLEIKMMSRRDWNMFIYFLYFLYPSIYTHIYIYISIYILKSSIIHGCTHPGRGKTRENSLHGLTDLGDSVQVMGHLSGSGSRPWLGDFRCRTPFLEQQTGWQTLVKWEMDERDVAEPARSKGSKGFCSAASAQQLQHASTCFHTVKTGKDYFARKTMARAQGLELQIWCPAERPRSEGAPLVVSRSPSQDDHHWTDPHHLQRGFQGCHQKRNQNRSKLAMKGR